MPYKNRIKTLEESIRILGDQIFHLEKSKDSDVEKIRKLQEKKEMYTKEMRVMIRAQWDNDHETVDFGDDR
jgi:prefoldin subunit 5